MSEETEELVKIYARPFSTIYDVFLSSMIESPENYVTLIKTFQNAGSNDVINLYINSPGGRLDAGLQLLMAIENSNAIVQTIISGECASMASFLFLAGDVLAVAKHSSIMFHHCSYGMMGKGGEMLSAARSAEVQTKEMLEDYTLTFLTDEERERILHGEDIYFNGDEILERLKNVGEFDMSTRSVTKYGKEEMLAKYKEMTAGKNEPRTPQKPKRKRTTRRK